MIPSNNTHKRGARRARQNKSSGSVTVRTPSQAFERQLSTRSDRSRLLGKTTISTGSVTLSGFNLNPAIFGARPTAYASIFSRWRIARLIIRPLSISSEATAPTGVSFAGVLDDTATSADVPTSATGVLDLRCSVSLPAQYTSDSQNEFEWRPLRGPTQWFYTTLEGSSSDPRLEVPASLWFASNSTAASALFQVDYDLMFEGAVDPLST